MRWICFPKNIQPLQDFRDIVDVFESVEKDIESTSQNSMESNVVLSHVRPGLEKLGYLVEKGKKKEEKIHIPVLFGENGVEEKSFEVDAYHNEKRIVIEVEAGRAVLNHQFLKDYFEACMMPGADYLCIAVRNLYKNGGSLSKDYDKVVTFFETMYLSNRIQTSLKGLLIIGY